MCVLLKALSWISVRSAAAICGGVGVLAGITSGRANAIFIADAAFAGSERAGRDLRIERPVRQIHVVAQHQRIVQVNRAQLARQFVVGADPDLREHVAVRERHHVGGGAADFLRLADVERHFHAFREVLVRIGNHQIGERKVDRRRIERSRERCVDGRRRNRGGDEILGRREGRHRLAVVIELGGRTVTGRDHAQLVGPLQRDVGARRVDERRVRRRSDSRS